MRIGCARLCRWLAAPLPYGRASLVTAVLLVLTCAARATTFHYWVEPCTDRETGCHADDPELAQWALEAWQAATSGKLHFEKSEDEEHAEIRIYWANGNQGLYGEARPILVNGVRGAAVYVLPPAENPKGVGLLPDAFLKRGADILGSVRITRPDDFLDLLAEGGSAPHFLGASAEKVVLARRLTAVKSEAA